jgi:hypothetical protein
VSSGGLIVLEAARVLPGIAKVAVYEPALIVEPATYTSWLSRYDREMAQGKVASALVTSMVGLRLGPPAWFPRGLLTAATKAMMKSQDKKAAPGEPTMRALAPTLHYEGRLLAEMTGKAGTFAGITADVLLLTAGSGGPRPPGGQAPDPSSIAVPTSVRRAASSAACSPSRRSAWSSSSRISASRSLPAASSTPRSA